MNPRTKKIYFGVVALAFFTLIVGVFGAVPADTIRTDATGVSTIVVDNLNITDTLYITHAGTTYNLTEGIYNLTSNLSTFMNLVIDRNEWDLVYGTTGDWFNYTTINSTAVYIGLEMHPLNITYDSVLVEPRVYDKDNTHWQLALYWINGTQITDNTNLMVMYHAHVDWDNPTGLTYIEANPGG